MDALKEYPTEFSTLFQYSFAFLSKINMRFYKNESIFRRYWRFVYIVPIVMVHYVTVCYYIWWLGVQGHFETLAYELPPLLISTQALLKALVLIPQAPLLTEIIEKLAIMWENTGLNKTQMMDKYRLLKKLRICNKGVFYFAIIGASKYYLSPFTETVIRRLVLKQDFEFSLATNASFPFDPKSGWLIYMLVYMFQSYTLFVCTFAFVGSELIMITLSAILSLKFTLLCEEMNRVRSRRNGLFVPEDENDEYKDDYRLHIEEFVRRHQNLCSLSQDLNKAFNLVIFINILFVGLSTCFFTHAAQFSKSLSYIVINYMGAASSLLYVFHLCYYGELISTESSRIGHNAYNNLWYNSDVGYKKLIFLIIMRSQKPCYLTSLNYTPVTLNMFSKVMSTTWSYISLMRSVYDEDD